MRSRLFKLALLGFTGTCLVAAGLFWLLREGATPALVGTASHPAAGRVSVSHLDTSGPYALKREFDLLGFHVAQLDHTRIRQGFLVVSGLGGDAFEELFSGELDASVVEPLANSVLQLRKPGRVNQLRVDELKVVNRGEFVIAGRPVAYQHMGVRVHTEKRQQSKALEVMVGLVPRERGGTTAVVSYGNADGFETKAFQKFLNVFMSPVGNEH